jgi:membrane fusion protein (multidrug efflux system)
VLREDRKTRIAELQRQIAEAEGGLAVEATRSRELAYRGEQRRVRAPIGGRIGEIADLRVGAEMKAGDNIGSIVPAGDVHAIASFPASSLGRIQPDQRARIRLDGFPWTEYGRLLGRVTRVAREPRDGRLRVELALEGANVGRIPLAHGLPGAVEVEVERVTPLQLVLRSAGRSLR